MVPALPSDVENSVRQRYDEPHRRYHDRRHLESVLSTVDELRDIAPDAETVRLAALFHDAIYVVGDHANEEASAALARRLLSQNGAGGALIDEVERLVLLTRTHAPAADDANGAVLCDADLRVLASSPTSYAHYVADVRDEWRHLDDETFARGRVAAMEGYLHRPSIFTTAIGREQWEPVARVNVGAELQGLRDSLAR